MKVAIVLILVFLKISILQSQPCSEEALLIREIKAIATCSDIDFELNNHQIFINPDCPSNDKLVVHLVGSFDNPANTQLFPSVAAKHGFKVINLKYPNGVATKLACQDSEDPDCFLNFRQEIVFGIESSDEVEVDQNNSIVNRLEKLLIHLQSEYPAEDWDDFLTESNEIKWSEILLSGHSQGGGHAAFIAKQFEVNRVIMFASPADYSQTFEASANWIFEPSATPDSSYFAFGNIFDNVVDYAVQYENWKNMNLLSESDSINVDSSKCNFNGSKILYSKRTPNGHSNLIIDNLTPLVDNVPVFTSVWEYMLGVCDKTSSTLTISELEFTLKTYPNPTTSNLVIESKELMSKVDVYDYSGRLLQSTYPNNNKLDIVLNPYKGLLILNIKLQSSNRVVIKKVIVE